MPKIGLSWSRTVVAMVKATELCVVLDVGRSVGQQLLGTICQAVLLGNRCDMKDEVES